MNQIFNNSFIFYKQKSYNLVSEWLCAESSLNSNRVYVGGIHNKIAVIGVISLDSNLDKIHFQKLKQNKQPGFTENTQVSCIKRIIGTDILLVGGLRCLHIIKLKKTSSELKFDTYKIFKLTLETGINSIVFHRDTIYAIGVEENSFISIKFSVKADMDELFKIENQGQTPSISEFSKLDKNSPAPDQSLNGFRNSNVRLF